MWKKSNGMEGIKARIACSDCISFSVLSLLASYANYSFEMLFQRKSILIKKKSKKGRSPITTISMDTISMKMRPRNGN